MTILTDLELSLLVRAGLAAAVGFVLGWERETCGSPAGDRTYALVGLGSAVVAGLGAVYFPVSAEKVIAGVITGIGFLGAGVIMRSASGEIRGLTTAAGMWATAAIGITIGVGHELLGLILGALVLLVLVWEEIPGLSRIGHRKPRQEEGARP